MRVFTVLSEIFPLKYVEKNRRPWYTVYLEGQIELYRLTQILV